ncbi:MAG: ribosome biogenesis GTPase Der [Candidatus Aadella gelida]|nr:ribosome biogenesis GTPase Der [Candidatus Aadella gelida]
MKNYDNLPAVCIMGRPNVGKSSLFNVLMGERRAVVVEQSGTTRDRVETITKIGSHDVKLIDTGGYDSCDSDKIYLEVKEQIYRAMEEASVVIMMVDTKAGILPFDEEVAALLRKFNKPVILVANKADNDKMMTGTAEFYKLGFGEPQPISCLHRRGLRQLKKNISTILMGLPDIVRIKKADKVSESTKIAMVGRPNVGKSSLVNNLLKRNRVIVSDVPGTTRDSIDTYFTYEDESYVLIDTAGIRHRRKIKNAVDVYSIMRSKESIARADVVMLLLDATDGVTKDDLSILEFVEENGKACLIVVNKWDLSEDIKDISEEDYRKHLGYAANHISKFPIAFVSAKTGKNILSSFLQAKILNTNLDITVSTGFLNRIFEKNDPSEIPIPRSKKRPNFLYIVQSSKRPVEFKFFVNDPSSVLPVHMSYIENKLRSELPLSGIPIKIIIKRSRKEKK